MRKLITFALFIVTLPLYATVYQVGPGKTYTNIGDVPWSTLAAGDTVEIYTKTAITAVTASASTSITFTATATSGSASLTSVSSTANLWNNQYITCGTAVIDDPIKNGGIGSGTITLVNTASATVTGTCTARGSLVTLTTSAASIPWGSTVWYSGISANACGVYSGKYGTPSGGCLCTINTVTTCGLQGSGLYSTATGGTACSDDNVTIFDPLSIPSGTTVYFYPPYFEKMVITATGSSTSPLTIEGIPDPTTGVLAALDANYATTGPNMAHAGTTAYHDVNGESLFALNANSTSYPAYVTLEDLRIQDTSYGESFYDGSNALNTYSNGAALRLEQGDHLTFKNDEIFNNDEGIFGATNSAVPVPLSPNITASSLTVTYPDFNGNHFYWNGNDYGGNYNHQTYIEALNPTYEFNYYDECQGNDQLKDRSVGTVIRYNYFNPCGRSLDLVDAQNSFYVNVPQVDLLMQNAGVASGSTSVTFTPVTLTANTTLNSNVITNISVASGWVGTASITGAGIPANTQIVGQVGSGVNSSLILNNEATATATGVTLTTNTVAGINVGDTIGLYAGANGWGYAGSTAPVMPTVSAVDVATDTLTLTSGTPAAVGQWVASHVYVLYDEIFVNVSGTWYIFQVTTAGTAGTTQPTWCTTAGCTVTDGTAVLKNYVQENPVLAVISQQVNPYKQTFVYGNVLDMNQNLLYSQNGPGVPIHYGDDSGDTTSDRAGTLYIYDNALVEQWDQSGSIGATYFQSLFQTESNADNISSFNNLFLVAHAPGSSNPPTYFVLAGLNSYGNSNITTVWQTGGNSQIGSSSSIGSNTSCLITVSGWQACGNASGGTLDPSGASMDLSKITTETATALYPNGITDSLFKLQTGSTAIGAASPLPSVITSNTLGGNFTPVYQPDGTARTNLLDLGAWQYSSHWWGGGSLGFLGGAVRH